MLKNKTLADTKVSVDMFLEGGQRAGIQWQDGEDTCGGGALFNSWQDIQSRQEENDHHVESSPCCCLEEKMELSCSQARVSKSPMQPTRMHKACTMTSEQKDYVG